MDCRMDVWDSTNLASPLYEKGERSVMSRRCRYPGFHTPASDVDGAVYVITVMVEYILTDMTGFM